MGQPDISVGLQVHREVKEDGYESLVRPTEGGARTIDLLIDGIYCAACIQKIESLFRNDNNIRNVRLNFSTRKLNIVWDGSDERANDYVGAIEKIGYHAQPFNPSIEKDQSRQEERFLLLSLGVAGFAMGNIMLLSVGLWSTDEQTMGAATRDFLHWISALIAIPAVMFAGRPFFRSAYVALSHGRTNMDVPISVGVSGACLLSLFETVRHGEHVFFDSAVMLIFFLLIGRYLDFRARKQARSAATDLLESLAGFADVVEDGRIRRLPASELKAGMEVRISMGEKFPADGLVSAGQGEVDASLITGETNPRRISAGSHVYAGTINLGAPVMVTVLNAAENTVLSDITRLMEQAEQGQALYVRIADRAAKYYTPVVHTFAAVTFLAWWLVLGVAWQKALMIAVSVLIITCPCALGLAVPVVQVLAISRLMRRGILVKAGDALERLAAVDTIFTDKTGTLTAGRPALIEGGDRAEVALAASLASHSRHPLSRALAAAYTGPLPKIETVHEYPGSGLETLYEGRRVRLGNRMWCGVEDNDDSRGMELWLCGEGIAPCRFLFEDRLREDARDTIQILKNDGYRVALLSGDASPTVEKVACEAGIEEYYAALSPPEKFALLEKAQGQNQKVLMIGDGLNDAPTLAGAYVSMAPGTAIDLAQNAADIVFMGDKFKAVATAIDLARYSQRLVRENFAIAILYNLIAVPLAVCGIVTPFIAALAMSGSSIIVIANSFRLKWRI